LHCWIIMFPCLLIVAKGKVGPSFHVCGTKALPWQWVLPQGTCSHEYTLAYNSTHPTQITGTPVKTIQLSPPAKPVVQMPKYPIPNVWFGMDLEQV
jgi:hypothetical protein